MTALDCVILALATWRLSALLVHEDGPGDLCARLRKAVGVWYDAASQSLGTTFLARLLTCVWCVSVWLGAAGALVYFLWPAVVWLALPLALSAVACLLDRWT